MNCFENTQPLHTAENNEKNRNSALFTLFTKSFKKLAACMSHDTNFSPKLPKIDWSKRKIDRCHQEERIAKV